MGLIADAWSEGRRATLTARLRWFSPAPPPALPSVEVFGLRFSGRLGVAAGVDRSGKMALALAAAGFAFVEVGSVTPAPWFLRNPGARSAAANLAAARPWLGGALAGVNLGSRLSGLGDDVAADYVAVLRETAGVADFAVVNLSSPLRRRGGDAACFLRRVGEERSRAPLLVKIDAADGRSVDILLTARDAGYAGAVVATQNAARFAELARALAPWPLVSVGGVASPADVRARLDAGAALVQVCGALLSGDGLTLPQRLARAAL